MGGKVGKQVRWVDVCSLERRRHKLQTTENEDEVKPAAVDSEGGTSAYKGLQADNTTP